MILRFFPVLALFLVFSCQNGSKSDKNDQILDDSDEISKDTLPNLDSLIAQPLPVFKGKINTYVEDEMRQYIEGDFDEFEIYNFEDGSSENWSEFMWGRCCTEADLTYSEIMGFDIQCNLSGKEYPFSNALDDIYSTTYVFDEGTQPKIEISLRQEGWYFPEDQKENWPGNLFSETDTILSPFEITLINGYVKSKSTFYNNARVKEIEVWKNGQKYCIIELIDTPRPQRIELDFPFFKNDIITFIPISIYPGEKYNDVCISEFQTNLGDIAHPSINERFKISELYR